MPAIRDFSAAATTVATGTTLVLPVPAYEVGDLLLAVFMADTGTATWSGGAPPSGSNWAHATGSPSTNTAQLVVMWKYAVANEPASYTFTGSASESFNGSMISIRDVHASTPFGATPVISFANQAAAAKFNFPTITTNVNNALVLYAYANSSAGVPSVLEGPAFGLVAADGVAESLGIGWAFQPTAGTTPANVGCSNIATGAGRVAVIQIAPPAGGAAVIPAYCAADASVYIDPLNGTTAYNGNTAVAATADTGFGTSLGGLTAADAGIAAATDVGINSFHSAARVTSISGSQNLAGVELVFATGNRPNISGKNLLVHVGPSTEGQLQRFSTIASGRGIWFGARSGAASNFKLWQVYGQELGSLRHQPVVINDQAGSTKATNGTLAPSSVLSLGFWVAGNGNGTTIWDFASLWMLDTTTVCGGNAAEPLNVAGIIAAAATGKERKSVLRQGASQAISYQPLQFGNGGTNPLYLFLDATAIEFPGQYNAALKEVTYNSVDNVAGLTYFAGASDTIKHINSVVSSRSKYHWRVHASSSAAASYDFRGLSIIGAGDVQLRQVTTFTGMSFVNCATIVQNSAVITDCTFSGSTISDCNAPGSISSCSFTSGGSGHAIVITAAGTYSFVGNTFSGYGAGGSTDAAIYNNSGGAVTLNISGGGGTPTVRNGAGASTTVNNTVSIEIVANVTLSGAEVRIYDFDNTPAGTYGTALAGTESHGSATYTYSGAGGNTIWIQIMKDGYVEFGQQYTMPGANGTLNITLVADTNA